jgi:hypothetical protein
MILDKLILQLEKIRADAGTGKLQVLFRDPGVGMLYDEIHPFLTKVLPDDNIDLYSCFDLQLSDLYVEI